MDCNKYTSWGKYSNLSDEESKQNEHLLITDAKKVTLFLLKYTSFPLKVNIYIFFFYYF